MGIRLFSRDSYDDSSYNTKSVSNLPNPDPKNYIIKRYIQIDKYLLIEINYPDCTNYEGNKILLYENITLNQLKSQKLIDPHFSENKNYVSPIARFEPTDKGWELALIICNKN
jgi:hypothetical protein